MRLARIGRVLTRVTLTTTATNAPSSTRLGMSRTAFTTMTISSAAIASTATSTASFCSTSSTAAADVTADLSYLERKTLDARLFFLEGMLRDPKPTLSQMCETISDLAVKPYARAAMLRDDVCSKFTQSFIAVPSAAELPSAEAYAMACNTLTALDVGSGASAKLRDAAQSPDDAVSKAFFTNVAGCVFLYSLVFRSDAYLANANAVVASCNGLLQLTANGGPAGLGMRKWIAEDFIQSNVNAWAAAASEAHPTGPAAEAAKQVAARFAE